MKLAPGLVVLSAFACVSEMLAQASGATTAAGAAATAVTSGSTNGSSGSATAVAGVVSGVSPAMPITPPRVVSESDARITNLSTRARVASDMPLITGFAITGSGPRTLLVRAVGPTLGVFGVADTLAAPHLKIHDSTGAVMLENAGWGGTPILMTATNVAGAFPFPAGSADSAIVMTFSPGTYSVEVSDDAGRGGVVLTEIYDVNGTAEGSRLSNVSTRNNVAAGGGELISGFVVSGTMPRDFLVRGVGPGLTRFAVGGVLSDPALTLFNTAGVPIATNDNWSGEATRTALVPVTAPVSAGASGSTSGSATAGTGQGTVTTATGAAQAAAIAQAAAVAATTNPVPAATARAGAFGLDVGSTDAALVVTLNPGAYTVQVNASAGSSANATTGTALLEIYELP